MAFTKQLIEHEFLFRWDDSGNPQGAYIAYRQSFAEDGVEVEGSSKLLDPRPVALHDADKLAEIGAAINTATLADNDAKSAQIASLTEQLKAAVAANSELTGALEQAREQAVELQAALEQARKQAQELQAQLDAPKAE